jgi:hypothetical protein
MRAVPLGLIIVEVIPRQEPLSSGAKIQQHVLPSFWFHLEISFLTLEHGPNAMQVEIEIMNHAHKDKISYRAFEDEARRDSKDSYDPVIFGGFEWREGELKCEDSATRC